MTVFVAQALHQSPMECQSQPPNQSNHCNERQKRPQPDIRHFLPKRNILKRAFQQYSKGITSCLTACECWDNTVKTTHNRVDSRGNMFVLL